MQLKETMDYDKFRFIKGNRNVSHPHIKSLAKAMENDDLHEYDPIIVNEKFEVIDGQHRLIARKLLNKKVCYIVVPKNGRSDLSIIQNLNSHQKNWTNEDSLRSYCMLGLPNYLLVNQFIETFGFPLSTSLAILSFKKSDNGNKGFRDGSFKIEDINKSSEIAKKIIEYGNFYPGFRRRSFVIACIKMFHVKQFSQKRMIEKMQYQSKKIVDCTDINVYLRLLEELYNYKQSPETKLRFI